MLLIDHSFQWPANLNLTLTKGASLGPPVRYLNQFEKMEDFNIW